MVQWLKNAVFYEIYPQSFKDSNADGIGDFNGIIEKLDYIKDMGFTAIWMNPCFASPFTDAGYDVEDYYKAAPRYGTNEDLKRLFDEVHARDMRIILDLVPGHTSDTCEWFKESAKPQKNKYSNRYIWTDTVQKGLDGIKGINGTMRGVYPRDGSYGVNFYSTQPALNYGFARITDSWQCSVDSEDAIATREELIHVIRFWLGMGCDGFRVDMAFSLVKNDEKHTETIKLWQDVFSKVRKEFPEAAFVSEWGQPDRALLAGFDMDFLLHLGPSRYNDLFRVEAPYFKADAKGDLTVFFERYLNSLRATEGKGFICIPSGNHDMTRIAHHLDTTQLKLAYAFLMSMPGVPFIYYGDEIGMRYLEGLDSVEGGFHRTGARSPMQWDNSPNCGFSLGSPSDLYIMVDPSDDRPTVEAQIHDENSVFNELKKIIKIRKSYPALQESGLFEPISVGGYPLVYKRIFGSESVLVAINPSGVELSCVLNDEPGDVIYQYNGVGKICNNILMLPPLSASYIKLQ